MPHDGRVHAGECCNAKGCGVQGAQGGCRGADPGSRNVVIQVLAALCHHVGGAGLSSGLQPNDHTLALLEGGLAHAHQAGHLHNPTHPLSLQAMPETGAACMERHVHIHAHTHV